jgi:small subunit ribosomal protein S5
VAIGDRRGRVGVGVAKGADVTDAISKAYAGAKKSLVTIVLSGTTIPHDIEVKLASAKVLLKPAGEGRGLIAGGAIRTVAELAGIRDITSKSLGSSNKLNVARATILALSLLRNTSKKSSTKTESKEDAVERVPKKSAVKKEKKVVAKKKVKKTV